MSKPDRVTSGFSNTIDKEKLWVAVWRRHVNRKGVEYSDIDEELYATPGEWREIVKQIEALLDGLPQ